MRPPASFVTRPPSGNLCWGYRQECSRRGYLGPRPPGQGRHARSLHVLVWHDAARSEDGIRQVARLLADTIYGLDARPAVAPPPAYTRTARIPGLTAPDFALLGVTAEEAISVGNMSYDLAAAQGRTRHRLWSSSPCCSNAGTPSARLYMLGDTILAVELAPRGFSLLRTWVGSGICQRLRFLSRKRNGYAQASAVGAYHWRVWRQSGSQTAPHEPHREDHRPPAHPLPWRSRRLLDSAEPAAQN